MLMHFWLRNLLRLTVVAGIGFSASCASRPSSSYRKVDLAAPDVRTEIAAESQRLQEEGRPRSDAEKIAQRVVSRRVIGAEKERRAREVVPLVAALEDLGRARGCWAFTATVRSERDGHASVAVERYDPFQPVERAWTLVSLDGRAPDAEQQAAFRRRKAAAMKPGRRLFQPRPDAERVERSALLAEFRVEESSEGATRFEFVHGATNAATEQLGGFRETFVVNRPDGTLRSKQHGSIGPSVVAAGVLTIEHYESSIEYVKVDAALPPFPSRTTQRYRSRRIGSAPSEVATETTYSDYRRVTCYDDRFQVNIGLPSLSDLDPASR